MSPDDRLDDLYIIATGSPRGRRVVLVHGSMDRSSTFGRSARRLEDLYVVRYDRRGYGRSRHAVPAQGLDDHVEDLLAVLGDEASALVGHSYGAVLAVEAALRRPELVTALGLFEPPMPWLPWWPADSAGGRAGAAGSAGDAAEAFMIAMLGEQRWRRLRARTRDERRAEGSALLTDMASLRTAPPGDPADLRMGVVFGEGSESPAHLRRAVTEMRASLTDSALVRIVGAQHGAHLSHPAEFAGFVRGVVEVGRVRI